VKTMDKIDEEIIKLYNDKVVIRIIADKVHLSEPGVNKRIRALRKQGLISKSRMDLRHPRTCELTPGKDCFNCPYPDCISGSKPTTKEEMRMLSDAEYKPKVNNYLKIWW